jgi:hypothetical protein
VHVKPFTVPNDGVHGTPFRSTNGSTFDLVEPIGVSREMTRSGPAALIR